jgi:hypothetical protein
MFELDDFLSIRTEIHKNFLDCTNTKQGELEQLILKIEIGRFKDKRSKIWFKNLKIKNAVYSYFVKYKV